MKPTQTIIQERMKASNLSTGKHLDISALGLGKLENAACESPSLESVDLRWNCLEEFDNFSFWKNLWWIDFSNNQIASLDSFVELHSLGYLNLSNNCITWNCIQHLTKLHILDLRLHSNHDLENDTHYRQHVVDCLPRAWMVDGRMVTNTERQQIQHFFDHSALTTKPVRHYLSGKGKKFVDAAVSRSSVYGKRAEQLSKCFALENGTHTTETDVRRLKYLTQDLQHRFSLNSAQDVTKEDKKVNFLQKLIGNRSSDKQKFSMLLLLLVCGVEFNLSNKMLKQSILCSKLHHHFSSSELDRMVSLSRRHKTDLISLMMSACKLDRDLYDGGDNDDMIDSNDDDGLYDRLYLALYHSVDRLLRTCDQKAPQVIKQYRVFRHTRTIGTSASHPRSGVNREAWWKPHRNLLACEAAVLLSCVPHFYRCVDRQHAGVRRLLKCATGDESTADRLSHISAHLRQKGGDVEKLYKEVSEGIRQHIEAAINNTIKKNNNDNMKQSSTLRSQMQRHHGTVCANTQRARFILSASRAYVKRPKSSALVTGERLHVSRRTNVRGHVTTSDRVTEARGLMTGDHVWVGSEGRGGAGGGVVGRVVAVPQKDIALLQVQNAPSESRQSHSSVPVGLLDSCSTCCLPTTQIRWGACRYASAMRTCTTATSTSPNFATIGTHRCGSLTIATLPLMKSCRSTKTTFARMAKYSKKRRKPDLQAQQQSAGAG